MRSDICHVTHDSDTWQWMKIFFKSQLPNSYSMGGTVIWRFFKKEELVNLLKITRLFVKQPQLHWVCQYCQISLFFAFDKESNHLDFILSPTISLGLYFHKTCITRRWCYNKINNKTFFSILLVAQPRHCNLKPDKIIPYTPYIAINFDPIMPSWIILQFWISLCGVTKRFFLLLSFL